MITGIIPRQGFELVRDRIAQILLNEIYSQAARTYDADYGIKKIFIERFTPINHSECPVINVKLNHGDYSHKDVKSVDGTYRYFIEITTNGKYTEEDEGDKRAKVRLHKLLGLCRAILDNPEYTTLSFPRPFIGNRHVESIIFDKPEEHSAESSCQGFLTLVVRLNETHNLPEGVLLESSLTKVQLKDTGSGYFWEFENA